MFRPLIGQYKGVAIIVMATVRKYINYKYQHKIKPLYAQRKIMYENIKQK